MGDSSIGRSLEIEGDIDCDGVLRVHGKIRGRVSATKSVEIAPSGEVAGDVVADEIEVRGRAQGNLSANSKAELKEGAQMTGDLAAPRVLIADGAKFKGQVDMGLEDRNGQR